MAKQFDIKMLYIVSVVTAFLVISFNERVGLVYALILLGVVILPRKKLFINNISGNTPKAIGYALGAYALLFIIYYLSSFVLQGFYPAVAAGQGFGQAFSQMIALMKTQAALPLASSKILGFVTDGILIPIIETFFIGTLLEFFSEISKTSLQSITGRAWILFSVVSGIFAWFHITVRGVSNVAWFITFAFGMITCYLIVSQREMESSAYLHILNNVISKLKGG